MIGHIIANTLTISRVTGIKLAIGNGYVMPKSAEVTLTTEIDIGNSPC